MDFDGEVRNTLAGLWHRPCCRQSLTAGRGLSVGFGEKIPHGKPRLRDTFYGEWEIGTWEASWRITRNGVVLCGSQDGDTADLLHERLQEIELGSILGIEAPSRFDIRVRLDGEVLIDFFTTSSVDDETFHVFCPQNLYVGYSWTAGWSVGRSDVPLT